MVVTDFEHYDFTTFHPVSELVKQGGIPVIALCGGHQLLAYMFGGTCGALRKLEPGEEYWWCACGRSASQPFCDGSHAGTGLSPMAFTVDEERRFALCQCKRTENSPWCDGTHKTL